MRTPAPLAAGLALVLAVGSVLVLGSASAGADDWTATVTNSGPIYPNSVIYFSGTQPDNSSITDISVNDGPSLDLDALCDGTQTEPTWMCSYTAPSDFSTGPNVINFTLSNSSSESQTSESLDFTVSDYPVPSVTLNDPTPLYADATTFDLQGTTDTQVESATIHFSDDSSGDCAINESPSGTWDCTFTGEGTLPDGDASVSFTFVGNPNTPDPLDFTILPAPDYSAVPAPPTFSASGVEEYDGLTGGAFQGRATLWSWNGSDGPSDPGLGVCMLSTTPSNCEQWRPAIDLTPGHWELRAQQNWQGYSVWPGDPYTGVSYNFRIPDAPTDVVAEPVGAAGITFSGTGTNTDTITVSQQTEGNPVVCTATVSEGSWSCDSDIAFDSVDLTFTVTATDEGAGEAYADGYASEFGLEDSTTYVTGGVSPATTVSATLTAAGTVSFFPGGFTVNALNNTNTIDIYSQNGEGWDYVHSWASGDPYDEAGCVDADTSVTCSNLDPNYWRFDAYQYYGGGEGYARTMIDPTEADEYFYIPEAPTVTTYSITSDGRIRLVGANAQVVSDESPSSGILLYIDGSTTASPCLATDGTTVIPANTDGSWQCETVPLSYGPHSVRAVVQDLGAADNGNEGNGHESYTSYVMGGLSAKSAAVSATFVAPPTSGGTTGGTTPPNVITPVWSFDLSGLDLGNVHPGDTFTITGKGLPPGSTVSFELHSTPVSIGSTVVKPDGTFSLTGTIPADIPAGAHQIIATLTGPGLAPTTAVKPLTIVDTSGATTTSTTSTQSSDAKPAEHAIVGEPAGDPTAPNILTHGLQSIADVVAHPGKIPAALAVGLVLLIFAVLPGHLLNATIAEQYERLSRRIPRLRSSPSWLTRWRAWLSRAPFVGGLLVTATTALLFCLADPRFGLTLATLRLFLAGAIALFVVVYLSNAIASLIVRRRWSINVQLSIRPLGLVLTAIGVIVSRLLDFSPGFLIGLVLGLTIAGKSAAQFAWKAVLIRSSVVIGLALLAWLGFSLFTVGEAEGSTFGSELFLEVLVAITTEGIVALLVELLPLRLLEGERIYRRSKLLWGALYLLCLFIFVVAVVPWEGNWEALGSSLWSWIAVVVVFGAICTGIYLFFRFFSKEHEEEEADEPGELVSISDNE
jgi:hypothetical protein